MPNINRANVQMAGLAGLIILAWMIIWHYLLRGFSALHADSPAVQGLSVLS